jgi:hypothetical protein
MFYVWKMIDRLQVRKGAVERKPGGNLGLSSSGILDAWNFIARRD